VVSHSFAVVQFYQIETSKEKGQPRG